MTSHNTPVHVLSKSVTLWNWMMALDVSVFHHLEDDCIELICIDKTKHNEFERLYLQYSLLISKMMKNDADAASCSNTPNASSKAMTQSPPEYLFIEKYILSRVTLNSDGSRILLDSHHDIGDRLGDRHMLDVVFETKPANVIPAKITSNHRNTDNNSHSNMAFQKLDVVTSPRKRGSMIRSINRRSIDDSHVMEKTIQDAITASDKLNNHIITTEESDSGKAHINHIPGLKLVKKVGSFRIIDDHEHANSKANLPHLPTINTELSPISSGRVVLKPFRKGSIEFTLTNGKSALPSINLSSNESTPISLYNSNGNTDHVSSSPTAMLPHTPTGPNSSGPRKSRKGSMEFMTKKTSPLHEKFDHIADITKQFEENGDISNTPPNSSSPTPNIGSTSSDSGEKNIENQTKKPFSYEIHSPLMKNNKKKPKFKAKAAHKLKAVTTDQEASGSDNIVLPPTISEDSETEETDDDMIDHVSSLLVQQHLTPSGLCQISEETAADSEDGDEDDF